jgi:hypothetical protein
MSAAHAGKAPWNNYAAIQDFATGRNRSVVTGKSLEWDLSSGWHPVREKGWTKSTKRHSKTLVGLDGKKYKLYCYDEPEDAVRMGFRASEEDSGLYQKRLAYAADAFKDPANVYPPDGKVVGCGHISQIQYAAKEQVLRVTFTTNGAICLFFRVPSVVAGQLIHFAETESKAYDQYDKHGRFVATRHNLGVEFWNLVRIRGQLHGSRYPFEYESHGSGTIVSRNGRHVVKMTPQIAKGLFGPNSEKLIDIIKNNPNLQGNVQFTTVLNDEEFAKYGAALEEIDPASQIDTNSHSVAQAFGNSVDTAYQESDEDAIIDKIDSESGRSGKPKGNADGRKQTINEVAEHPEASDLARLVNGLISAQTQGLKDFKDFNSADIQIAEDEGLSRVQALRKVLLECGQPDLVKSIDLRTGKIRSIENYRQLKDFVRSIKGAGIIKSWMEKYYPAEYTRRYLGRVWTTQELRDIANPTVPGNLSAGQAEVYKKFIKVRDWQGALNFLKENGTHKVYKNGSLTEDLGYQKYAGPYDTYTQEE